MKIQGLTFVEIGEKLKCSKSMAHKVYYSGNHPDFRKQPMGKYKYFCSRCQKDFYSALYYDEAICIYCGTSKILF